MKTPHPLDSGQTPSQHRHRFHEFRWLLLAAGGALLIGVAWWVWSMVRGADAQEIVILGQTKLAAGTPAALRIQVRHRDTKRPVTGAKVTLFLKAQNRQVVLGRFTTGPDGSVSDGVFIPELAPGEHWLVVEASSRLGRDGVERRVEVFQPVRLLLTADKPVYQPGQTIHLRALGINTRTQRPLAGGEVVFEVSDAKGNKVFKEKRVASRFGIASADFALAAEVGLGRYRAQASSGAGTAERTIEIKEYVLPRFKVTISPERSWYRPGQTVTGAIVAQYFFGQPVKRAAVELAVETMDTDLRKTTAIRGATDEAGRFEFQFPLPDALVGLPQNEAKPLLYLTAQVEDTGHHTERATMPLNVSATDLELAVIPEQGRVALDLPNLLYVIAGYPDGNPARCVVSADGREYPTDTAGVCTVPYQPRSVGGTLRLTAVDRDGRKASVDFAAANGQRAPLLLRPDRAVYRAGQTARLEVFTVEPENTVFVDLVRAGQTVLTRSVEVRRGKGELKLDLPADLAGPLKVNAYVITPRGEDWGCSRLLQVRPAGGLQIQTRSDKAVYQPGETARFQVSVHDPVGRPAPAALGVCAVDEAVFAMHENQAGLLAQFLEVEREMFKPRYQIKFFDSPSVLLGEVSESPALAQAYLSALAEELNRDRLSAADLEGNLPKNQLERIRGYRNTPIWESLRREPSLASAIRFIEGEGSDYNLRECTGPTKVQAAELRRRQFVSMVKRAAVVLVVGGFFVGAFAALVWHARSPSRRDVARLPLSETGRQLALTVVRQHAVLSSLWVAQILLYPLLAVLCAAFHFHRDGVVWGFLAAEVVLVGGTLTWRWAEAQGLNRCGYRGEARVLCAILAAYLGQFVFIRTAIVLDALRHYPFGTPFQPWLWVLAALALPVVLLIVSWAQTGQLLSRHQAEPLQAAMLDWTSVVLLFVLVMLLGGMMLPALAKARAKSQRVGARSDLKSLDAAIEMAELDRKEGAAANAPAPRIRRHFPETLYWQPELITDDEGRATLEIPLADSITTWRTSLEAISVTGQMGSSEVPIRVFQDFFVELDLPVALRLGDQVSAPVLCYNYLAQPQSIRLSLAHGDGFASASEGRVQAVTLPPNEARSVCFTVQAQCVGKHRLLVTAQGAEVSDAVEREVTVLPIGARIDLVKNSVLRERDQFELDIPAPAVPGSGSLLVKLYPSRFSEIVEGLDSIFQAPFGCFEQTSSVTYPNVLALAYLQSVGRLTPELELKARKFINAGYQRLLTFEVPGGGFEWFGRPPANICLTAYGVLEFADMAKVHPVDEAVIQRAVVWLDKQQNSDGSWDEKGRGWTWAGRGPITAFVAAALAESGRRPACLDKALDYLALHLEQLNATYACALAANAFLARWPQDARGMELVRRLEQSAQRAGTQVHWNSTGCSMTCSTGFGLDVETTALAALALLKAGDRPQTAAESLNWISAQKDPHGAWGTTQATILAMRALLKATGATFGRTTTSRVTVSLNGQPTERVTIDPEHSEVMQLVSLTDRLTAGPNRVELSLEPAGELAYQIAGAYWIAQPDLRPAPAPPPLELAVDYDRTALAVNDTLQCRVSAVNRTSNHLPMAIVDLGIPPGFEVDASSFRALQAQGTIARFEVTGQQVILYLRSLPPEAPLQFNYALRAKYPVRVETPRASLYEYYTPTNRVLSKPAKLVVR